jgi:Holliday junction resolvase-like predicted endonuclease
MKKYVEAQNERGFKLVAVWVPLDKVEKVRKTAERWRREQGHVTLRADMIYRGKKSTGKTT